ncbi:transposable element Tcb1 transposase [Trichonephila clavipes]|nr:transposable element Tcb1 transposase [Trichonephila clavipes]
MRDTSKYNLRLKRKGVKSRSSSEKIQDQWGPVRSKGRRDQQPLLDGSRKLKCEIGIRVGRNQTTVMPIWDRWKQEGTTDRRGRSHPPQCTTLREDRQIVHMAVTDRSVTSRTIAQNIESATHHSVSARTIRRRLQQSGPQDVHCLVYP